MTILEQRIAARDWQNVSKIEGRSVHAVRMSHDATYRLEMQVPDASSPPVAKLVLVHEIIARRVTALGWTKTRFALEAGVDRNHTINILSGKSPLTDVMRARFMLVLEIAEASKMERAA